MSHVGALLMVASMAKMSRPRPPDAIGPTAFIWAHEVGHLVRTGSLPRRCAASLVPAGKAASDGAPAVEIGVRSLEVLSCPILARADDR
ncbi:MAG: hypothetical protein H6876_02565 [Hyphomicrobiaceae bacterium]|nr:hypothetical protein [Hyphomicrobiaceae bacterium]